MNEWIKCKERLPNDNEWVLGYIDSIHRGDDLPACAIVKIRKGITVAQRENMALCNDRRAKVYRFGDECDNNKVGYAWITDGPMTYFGQEILYWQPLPKIPTEQIGEDI